VVGVELAGIVSVGCPGMWLYRVERYLGALLPYAIEARCITGATPAISGSLNKAKHGLPDRASRFFDGNLQARHACFGDGRSGCRGLLLLALAGLAVHNP